MAILLICQSGQLEPEFRARGAGQAGFSDLRVINEDRVPPGQGFGMHPYRDDLRLEPGDGVRLRNPQSLQLASGKDAEVLVFDLCPDELPQTP